MKKIWYKGAEQKMFLFPERNKNFIFPGKKWQKD